MTFWDIREKGYSREIRHWMGVYVTWQFPDPKPSLTRPQTLLLLLFPKLKNVLKVRHFGTLEKSVIRLRSDIGWAFM